MTHMPYYVAAWLFVVGLYGVVTSRHMVHLIICLSVVQSSTYVLLLAVGYRATAAAQVFTLDPVVQALMLADVVVGVTATALLLTLAVKAHERTGKLDPNDLGILRG